MCIPKMVKIELGLTNLLQKNETMQVFELVYSTLYYTNVAAIDGWRCARHITRLAYSTVSTYVCVHD